jgi:DNA-binding transcriptional regulator YiaG
MPKKIKLVPRPKEAEILTAGRAIWNWRKTKQWSRRVAAEYLDINERTLESWEYETHRPHWMKVAEKLWLNKRGRV